MTESDDDPLLSMSKVAEVTGIGLRQLADLRSYGELTAVRADGRNYFVRQSEIHRFIAARTEALEIRKMVIERQNRMEEEPDFSVGDED
jgi:hypothetical protein